MGKQDRRHGAQDEGANPSPLGAGWPPLSFHYSRDSVDLADPPLVYGRYPLRDEGCPLCTLGEHLVDRGYAPESAAWAESDLSSAMHKDEKPEVVLETLHRSYGVEVSEEILQRHVEEHLPSSELQSLGRLRQWSPHEFGEASWRSIFDLLYLVTERTRQGLASGRLEPTVSEGANATRILSELLVASAAEKDEASQQAVVKIQYFMARAQGAIEDTVHDEAVRSALYSRLREIVADSGASSEDHQARERTEGPED